MDQCFSESSAKHSQDLDANEIEKLYPKYSGIETLTVGDFNQTEKDRDSYISTDHSFNVLTDFFKQWLTSACEGAYSYIFKCIRVFWSSKISAQE